MTTNRTTGAGGTGGRVLGSTLADQQRRQQGGNGEASGEDMDGSRRFPAVQAMTPNGTVACYSVAFIALALGFIFTMVQLNHDFELAHKWQATQCVVMEVPEIVDIERGHGGNACVDVIVSVEGGKKDYTVTLNASPEGTWFPTPGELMEAAEKLRSEFSVSSVVECSLSKSKRFVKLFGSWRHEHQGCKPGTFDLTYKPYVFLIMVVIAVVYFRLNNYEELQTAWAESDAPGTLPNISVLSTPKPDFVTKGAWATEAKEYQPQSA